MKIDRSKLKKCSSEVPPDCKALIEKLKVCDHTQLLDVLSTIKSWNCGKCELYHWIDTLDTFDYILEFSCEKVKDNQWCLPCDEAEKHLYKRLLLCVLQFTALLIEHSFSRHFYNSMEHLTTLLSSSDMNVVLAVLNLLYVFSKRSNFITRLNAEKRQVLLLRLLYLAESWGGKENGFGLAECCQNLPIQEYPSSASTLHFEYYAENSEEKVKKTSNTIIAIHIDNVDKIPNKTPSEIMEELIKKYLVPEDKRMQLFTHIRLAHSFSDYTKRTLCVQARLQALSILVYCNSVPENANSLLYNGLIEELVDVLELQDPQLIEIKAAALRTMTSIIHLDRNPKLNSIIDATGAASYHGFLPVLVRSCIQSLTEPDAESFPLPFATALFSFLYHLASYENGGDALVSCAMMESLLKVINWHSTETEHITFVTRAVRVIDLITNLDMQAFQTHGGLSSFIQRLEMEVNACREDQPFVISPKLDEKSHETISKLSKSSSEESNEMEIDSLSPNSKTEHEGYTSGSKHFQTYDIHITYKHTIKKGSQCLPQRAALLKSMLNFLKKSIQDPAFSENIRHLMEGSLPNSLKHIISNAEYYGPSLFLLATDVVTVYVFQEPTLLPNLQNNGLTDTVLHALLIKEVPATREVLASLPNVFSALCLNSHGLESFVACKPFEKLFRVLVSPEYLPAMRRRRSSDPIGDAASNLGNAMDELMRHQPSLRSNATAAIIKLLEELFAMGRDPRYICSRPTAKPETVTAAVTRIANISTDDTSSDEEEDEEEDPVNPLAGPISKSPNEKESINSNTKVAVPLVDYILNVMRFVDAILSNNSTDDHCREFVKQRGLVPLMAILGSPNLPIDFPVSPTCQSISNVCKSILNLAHEPQVIKQGLLHLNEVLQSLEPLHRPLDPPGGSVLLEELISAPNINEATQSAQSTPLLHYMAAAHAYIIMFIHVCRTGQSDIRTISISHWGSELGLSVLKGLSSLYISLVWESTILLALCSNDRALAEDKQFGKQQLEKLLPKETKIENEDGSFKFSTFGSGLTSKADIGLGDTISSNMDVDEDNLDGYKNDVNDDSCHVPSDENCCGIWGATPKKPKTYTCHIRQIKPLLSGASRLGRALAELFGLLVKLCVGSPVRQRRGLQYPPLPSVPSSAARAVAAALTNLLTMGLSSKPPITSPVPKFRLTFYICSVGFTSPMIFDERKYPYHLILQKFLSCGGLDAFFNTFNWALTLGNRVPIEEGLEHPDLPDGSGEFLDAWLMLLEKLVNTKNILESPHAVNMKLSQTANSNFNALSYLIHIHKRAFENIMYLWNRRPLLAYGERIAESMLTITCHILKAENIIKEKLAKGEDKSQLPQATLPASQTNRTGNRNRQVVDNDENDVGVNQDHLVQLIDMGFSRNLATEALLNTVSLEQATDYLLTYPVPTGRTATPGTSTTAGMDWEMSEEDQMLRAIAMSLGENVLVSTNQVEGEPNKTDGPKEQAFTQKEEPLSSQKINKFTENVVDGCLKLADALPDTVYRSCDLLIAVAARNGEDWRNESLIERLIDEIDERMQRLLKYMNPNLIPKRKSSKNNICKLSWIPMEPDLAVRLHLFTLIFEEMKIPSARAIQNKEVIGNYVKLVDLTAQCLSCLEEEPTPRWLSFVILSIDQYEKASIMSVRKSPLLMALKRQWKWFDDRTGKWNNYTPSNNKLIDEAYKNGETNLRFTAGRRNYTVQLTTMVQINEETGNWRPIMLSPNEKDKNETKTKEDGTVSDECTHTDSSPSEDNAQTVDLSYLKTQPIYMPVVKRLRIGVAKNLVRYCVKLMKAHLDPDTLHAAMRLCLRLTRKHGNAVVFAEMDGPRTLLYMTQPYAFVGFTSLTALLFRHVLEDPYTLASTMEKVIRSATAGGSSLLVSKEMHYVFRVLGPAACRENDVFVKVASNTLRLAIMPLAKLDEEESRLNHSVQMLKSCPSKPTQSSEYLCDMSPNEIAHCLIGDLLHVLIKKPLEVPEESSSSSESTSDTLIISNSHSSPTINSTLYSEIQDITNCDVITDEDDGANMPLTMPNVDGICDSTESLNTSRENKSAKDSSKENKLDSENSKNIPIIKKSATCRLLAELVRSYSQCARWITSHCYRAGQSELITENCTALAFILDNLLHCNQTAADKETPALARVLISALASCNHSVDAQSTLVNEVRFALQRALALPESTEKHSRIQALSGLISSMIDSCPTTSSQNALPGCTMRNQSPMTNIIKILLRKGIVMDLAKIPHYLDLSSPHMAATVNSALKPLETLSRIVNLPSSQNANKNKGKNSAASNETRDSLSQLDAMEEDSSARCSADVSMPFCRSDIQSQALSVDSALEGLMNEILDRHDHSTSTSDLQQSNISSNHPESSDSESNSESGHSHSEDDVGREDRRDDVEDDASPRFEEYPSLDLFHVQDRDDSLYFQLEEVFPSSSQSSVIFGGTDAMRTFQFPVTTDDSNNGNETPGPTVPPAPRSVSTVHPLLVRHDESQCSMQPRVNRRQRGYRTSIGGQTWHMYAHSNGNNSARQQNPSVILQGSQPAATTESRVVFANSDFRILATEDEVFEIQEQTNLTGDHSGTLSSIPSTLNRWAEESRVLDGDSIHDCITGIKPSIVRSLESHRDDELTERREKRRKLYDKATDKTKETVLSDPETLDGMTGPEQNQSSTMEVAEPVNPFENIMPVDCEASTARMPEMLNSVPRLHHFDIITPSVISPTTSNWLQQSASTHRPCSDLGSFCNVMPVVRAPRHRQNTLLEAFERFRPVNPDETHPLRLEVSLASSNVDTGSRETHGVTDSDILDSSHMIMPGTLPENLSEASSQPRPIEIIDLVDSDEDDENSLEEDKTVDYTLSNQGTEQSENESLTTSSISFEKQIISVSDESSKESTELPSTEPNLVNYDLPQNLSRSDSNLESSLLAANSERCSHIPSCSSEISSNFDYPEENIFITPDPDDELRYLPEELTSHSHSSDDASNQPRVSSPSLLSDDAVPCERPTETESAPSDFTNVLGGVEIPEGVDPSFLAALPDNIRQEVIAEQLRLQRLRQRSNAGDSDSNADDNAFTEVNPEFLAALPPNIQEEVLAQQRAEQQRLTTQDSNPDAPVDPTSFIQTLPQGLRQQVLADMDDSLLALLPSELATEAHSLRRELEARHRQIQERFFSSHAGTALSRILRSAGRVGARYTIHSLPHRHQWSWNSLPGVGSRGNSSPSGVPAHLASAATSHFRFRGRLLLDHEALACLLVLLFVDEPQLNTGRLHRVLRNLCHYGPTRKWVVKSLLSILERTKDFHTEASATESHRHKRTQRQSSSGIELSNSKNNNSNRAGQPSWLSISLDAALGCRTNVFQIRRLTAAQRRASERNQAAGISTTQPLVTIHPLASPVICRHVLDTLISLAKIFPVHFLPATGKLEKPKEIVSKSEEKTSKGQVYKKDAKKDTKPTENLPRECDFWEVLVKLDNLSTNTRKTKISLRNQTSGPLPVPTTSTTNEAKVGSFQASPLAELIGLLSHPVVKRSSVLTDRLLRLLALISLALNEPKVTLKSKILLGVKSTEVEAPTETATNLSTSQLETGQKKTRNNKNQSSSNKPPDENEEMIMKHYLKLAVEVLTSKTCSEEGLEDATALLLRLSRGCVKTRRTVLYLLLDGARELGQVVCKNISALMHELKSLNVISTVKHSESDEYLKDTDIEGKHQSKGTLLDRFTNRAVVITAPSKIKDRSGRELQLPSMSSLTSKTSSQAFFLRVLKVIIQLIEFTPLATKSKKSDKNLQRSNSSSSVSAIAQPDFSPSQSDTPNEQAQESFSCLWDLQIPNSKGKSANALKEGIRLSSQLLLDELWDTLSDCLTELAGTPDHHAVLVLQPAVEAFFLVHASSEKENKKKDNRKESKENEVSHLQDQPPASPLSSLSSENSILNITTDSTTLPNMSSDTVKFLKFAETHRTVLNQILRQSTTPLVDGPFSVLVDYTRVLDFDVKRRYFRQELERMDDGSRREDLAVHVRRDVVFEDSFRELHRRTPEEWKNRFYIVFEGEEGQDAGGLLREWYTIISREIFNPMYALFTISPGDRVTYMINSSSHCNSNHLSYFKFVGRVIAKAVYDNKLLESYFTRSFYKHILGKNVKYMDMESEDYSFYQGLVFLLEHGVNELGYELTFSVEVQEFGVTEIRDLRPNGRNLPVTEENKNEYVKLVCQEKMTGAIRKQLKAFLEGFYEIIPKRLISIFNEQELELLISGLPNIDIDDLKANTEYHKYQPNSLQIQWFWRALRSFDQADRANFLQFVTGTSKVPLQGFVSLEGMNGTQKFQIHRDDRSTDRLPSAHTCFNQLDLPAYETYDKLRSMMLKAIHECSEGFGFA